MGCARQLRDASLSWVHNARDCGDYWPRQLERKKRLAFVSDEKRAKQPTSAVKICVQFDNFEKKHCEIKARFEGWWAREMSQHLASREPLGGSREH